MGSKDNANWLRLKIALFKKYYQKHGFRRTVIRYFLRLAIGYRLRSDELIFFEIDLKDVLFSARQNNSGVEILRINSDDMKAIEYRGWMVTKNQALNRLKKGDLLFVAKDGDSMIAQQWFEPEIADMWYFEALVPLPSDTVYMSFLYTAPEYRNRGILKQLMNYALENLKSLGYRRVFVVVRPTNTASQALLKKFGFKPYQRARCHVFYFMKYICAKDYEAKHTKKIYVFTKTNQRFWNLFSKFSEN